MYKQIKLIFREKEYSIKFDYSQISNELYYFVSIFFERIEIKKGSFLKLMMISKQ